MALVGLQTRLFPHFLLRPPVPFGKHPPLTSSTGRHFWGKHYTGSALEVPLLT